MFPHFRIATLIFCSLFFHFSQAQEIGTFHIVHIQREGTHIEGYKVTYRGETPIGNRLVDVSLLEPEESGSPRLVIVSYDIRTGKLEAREEYPWTKDRKIEKAIGSGEDLLIVSYSFDEDSKQLDLFCEGYDPITLNEIIAPVDLGSISLSDYTEGYKLGLKFTRSPDGNNQLILFDRIRTKEDDQQLVFCWVMDKSARSTWSAAYPMDVEADKYATTGYLVSDDGVVHLCSREKVRMRGKGGRFSGHSYSIYRLNGEERIERELAIPEGKWISIMTLLPDGDRIVAAGFLADEAVKKVTNEYFTAVFSSSTDEKIDLHAGPFTEEVPEPINYMTAAMGDDGILFLSGTDRENYIMACAIDTQGALLYSTLIPRKRFLYPYGPPHYTLTDGKAGMLLMPDNDANLGSYRTGGKLKDNKDDGNHVVLVTFDRSGKPAYQRLPLKGIDMLYTAFDRTNGGRTVIFTANQKNENNALEAVKIFWHLDKK